MQRALDLESEHLGSGLGFTIFKMHSLEQVSEFVWALVLVLIKQEW